jgi:hypothetical protein
MAVDYIYSSSSPSRTPQLAIRVVANLAIIDGVTAQRIAMHAYELIEGKD